MDNSSLVLLFFLTQLPIKKNKSLVGHSNVSSPNPSSLEPIMDYFKDLEIDPISTKEKIRIMSKVGPYFPEKYIGLINQSMLHAERIIKVNEVLEFLKENKKSYIDKAITVENSKDRINKIVKTVQNETTNTNTKDIGMVVDLLANMDKYKKMFAALNTLMNSENPMEEPDKLINMILPLFGEDEKNKDKIKEMSKMLEIIKALNAPGKAKKKDEDDVKAEKTPKSS